MRFVIAIVLFVVAAVGISLGVAQRTVLLGPDHVAAEAVSTGGQPFVVIDGSTLSSHPGSQTISIEGAGDVFMAYGRTDDVSAWVGEAGESTLELDAESGDLVADTVPGIEESTPSPEGSDLWIQEFTGDGELVRKVNVPDGVSVLIASDGTAAAPAQVSVTWPLDNSTPWSGPLIVGGIAVLLLGLLSLIWALWHARRRNGPRRKTPKLPKAPRPAQLKPAPRRKQLTTGPERGRRSAFAALPVVLVGALALSACTADVEVPEATPSATDAAIAEVEPPVVTEQQFTKIVSRVAESVTAADEAQDAALAAERLTGPALEQRTANYKARKADSAIDPVAEFPAGEVELILPQQRHDWPRAVFAAVNGVDSAKYGIMFVQEDARAPYLATYVMRLTQSIPEVAPVELGAARLSPDSKLLAYTPDQLAAAYGDVLISGDASEFATMFDPEGDVLRDTFGAAYKADRVAELSNAKVSFSSAVGDEQPFAFSTLDTGAIVAVSLSETEKVTPKESGATINPAGGVKALSGKAATPKGINAVYGIQVLFYVPPVTDEGAMVQVLGFTQGLVAASEVP